MSRTSFTVFLLSLITLFLIFSGLYHYTDNLEANIQTPKIISVSMQDGNMNFAWESVDYATSYRIYVREKGGRWQLVKPVGRSECSYTEYYVEPNTEYSVRACNVSGSKTSLSGYSEVIRTGE